jgi:GWxTD domain-containing protein
MDILPLVSDYYPEDAGKLVVYGEAYNADMANIEGGKYLLTFFIIGDEGEVPDSRRYKRKDASKVTPILETFDISQLPSGNYELVVEMRDPQNEELASRSIGFTRMAALNKDFMAMANSDAYVAKPGLAFNNPDSIRSYVSWLYPLAQNVERGTIDSQVKQNNTETLQSFFQAFWEDRAPEDPIGAWLNYVKDVWYVNKKYRSPVMEGYRTDRGRVYLQYGKPNTIVERHNNPNYFPCEIWHYYKIERFNDRRFLFYSRNVVNYDFNLLHSDMLGEVQNHDWPTLIRTKNNDLRPTDSALNRLAPRDTYSMDEIEDLFYNPR